MQTENNSQDSDVRVAMHRELAPEVITLIDRLEQVSARTCRIHLSKAKNSCRGGGYCIFELSSGMPIAHGVHGVVDNRKQKGLVTLARDIGEWLFIHPWYLTSAQGGYHHGGVRLDRYILAVTLERTFDQWAEGIAIAALKHGEDLSYKDYVGAIHASYNPHINQVLELK